MVMPMAVGAEGGKCGSLDTPALQVPQVPASPPLCFSVAHCLWTFLKKQPEHENGK